MSDDDFVTALVQPISAIDNHKIFCYSCSQVERPHAQAKKGTVVIDQAPAAGTSLRESFWLSCHAKHCCYNTLVQVTGRDIYRISAALGITPTSFLVPVEVDPAPDTFRLDRDDTSYRLALTKRPVQPAKKGSPQPTPPCIFLLRLNNGHHLCGLGDLRPMLCRCFPYFMVKGVLQPANDGSCTCRVWTLNEIDREAELRLQAQRQAEHSEYTRILAEWNHIVDTDPMPGKFNLTDFYDFLIASYASLPEM